MQHHSTYFRPELNSFFTKILFWWWESRAAASSLSSTSRDSQKGSGLNVNMMSHALFHSLSPMKRGVVILEYTRVIGEKNLLIQYIQVVSWPHFLGHFSWLASLISVLSLGYTAVQSRTLQFSSHCVWKYSYSTVKHIREHIFISPNVSVNSDWSSKIFVLNIFPPGRWMFTTIAPGLIMCWTVLNPVQQLLSCFVSLMQANNLTHLFHDHRKCLTRGCLHQLGFK